MTETPATTQRRTAAAAARGGDGGGCSQLGPLPWGLSVHHTQLALKLRPPKGERPLMRASRPPCGRREARRRAVPARQPISSRRMLIVFVLFWLLVGLAVFFVAMRGGPNGAREALHTESTARHRAVIVVIVVCSPSGWRSRRSCSPRTNTARRASGVRGAPHRDRAAGPRTVRALLRRLPHADGGQVRRSDRPEPRRPRRRTVSTAAGRKALVLSAISEGRARGLGQMPALLYQGKEAEQVAEFVAPSPATEPRRARPAGEPGPLGHPSIGASPGIV